MRPPDSWHERRRVRKDGQPYRRNLWHVTLMETYAAAAWDWWRRCEAACHGYPAEEAEFREAHPRPQLGAFMVDLSRDWRQAMCRCCSGETYVQPNGLTKTGEPSWAVICFDCGRVLAVVDGPREEVYADL